MATVANIKFEGMQLFVGASPGPFESSLAIAAMYDIVDITSQRTGTDIIESMVTGRKGNITVELLESDLATFKQIAGLAAGSGEAAALAVGAKPPTHAIRLHPVSMGADTTEDIVFHKARFGNISRVASTGSGPARWSVEIVPMLDTATGKVWSVGYTAP